MKLTAKQLKRIIKEEAEAAAEAANKPWKTIAHHVTLNMGGWKGDPSAIGQMFPITVTGLAGDDKVLAVGVTLPNGPESKNANPHITVAVDYEAGGKPVMSNKLDWSQTQTLSLSLEGQLQDAKQTGSYTGLVLTEDGHNQLVNAVNSLGYTLQPNPGQTPPLASQEPVKQESVRLLKSLIREFID